MRFERDLRLARAARTQDHIGEDAQWRAQALAEAGTDAGRRLRVARADLSADDIVAARALLDSVRAADSGLATDDRRSLARLLIDAGEPDLAMGQIDMLAVQASAGVDAANDAHNAGATKDAGKDANGATDTEGLAQGLLLRARAHRAQRDAVATGADWAALDAVLPPDEVTHRIEAVELMDGDRQTARAWMADLLQRHPQDPEVLLEAGRQARRDQNYDAAVQYLREVGSQAGAASAPPTGA